jgi:hypothetical protein
MVNMGNVTGMTASELQNTASLVAVLGIAIIGVALVVSTASWKRWITRYRVMLSPYRNRSRLFIHIPITIIAVVVFGGFFAAYVIIYTMRSYNSGWLPGVLSYYVYAFVAIAGMAALSFRKTVSIMSVERFKPVLFLTLITYFGSWTFLIVSILYCLSALMYVASVALGVEVVPRALPFFASGRFFMADGVRSFVAGIISLGIGAISEFYINLQGHS